MTRISVGRRKSIIASDCLAALAKTFLKALLILELLLGVFVIILMCRIEIFELLKVEILILFKPSSKIRELCVFRFEKSFVIYAAINNGARSFHGDKRIDDLSNVHSCLLFFSG